MKALFRFFRLSDLDRRALVSSFGWLTTIRLGLCMFSLETISKWLFSRSTIVCGSQVDTSSHLSRITWAIDLASQYVPGARTCLVQALAAQRLLIQKGIPACLQIGLARTENGDLEGHAWVENDGRVVIGGQGYERFTPLESWRGRDHERTHENLDQSRLA